MNVFATFAVSNFLIIFIMSELIFTSSPAIKIASNTFINTPVILRFEDLNLIEVVKGLELGYEMKIPIFHPDGTHLADSHNSRIFLTKDGKNAGITMDKHPGIWVCKMNNKELFEIRQQEDNLFKTTAELYTNDGFFIKCFDNPLVQLLNDNGLTIGKLTIEGNLIANKSIGINFKKNGAVTIG